MSAIEVNDTRFCIRSIERWIRWTKSGRM